MPVGLSNAGLKIRSWYIVVSVSVSILLHVICNSYNMATRALADLSPEGAKRPRAINQSSARGAML